MVFSRTPKTISYILVGLFVLAFLVVTTHPFAPSQVSQADDGWNATPVFFDDFTGAAGTAPDPTKWGYDIGTGSNHDGWGNGELEYYTNSTNNCYQDGQGHLVIKAIQENIGTGADARSYSSCRLVSTNKGDWENGRIEVKAKLPAGGKGIWPGIWMLPTDTVYGVWPRSGELDMMEMVSDTNTIYSTIHYGVPWVHKGDPYTLSSNDYHTYAMEWDENQIRFYVDNVLFETRNSSEWYSSGSNRPAPFDQRFHLLMNLAVGGAWPGSPDATTQFPQQMLVDYVKVQQRPGTHVKPIPGKVQAERYATSNSASVENTSDTGAGQDVTGLSTASTLDYNVSVDQTGAYEAEYRVASPGGTGAFKVLLDGNQIDAATVPNTGGAQNWQTISSASPLNLTQGNHTLRVQSTGSNFNLNWLRFIPTGTRYVTDFENFDGDEYFGTYSSGGSSVVLSKNTATKTQGNYALQVDYNQASGGVQQWFQHYFADWHYDTGVKMDIFGQNTGRRLQFEIEDTADERYDYGFLDNFTGWKTIVMPFSSFTRSTVYQPDGAPNDGLDRQDVNAINFQVLDTGAGTLYFDNLIVYDGASTSNPTPEQIAPLTYQGIPGQIQGSSYGPMHDVQVQDTTDVGGGKNVGYINTGSWMDYYVNVPVSGVYQVQYRVSSPYGDFQKLQLMSGATVLNTISVPNTGDWQNWTTVTGSAQLTAGQQVLRVYAAYGGFNFNWISFSNGSVTPPPATATPTPTHAPNTPTPTTGPTATPVPSTPTPVASGTNIALNKTATTSSTENGGTLASAAVDGNTGTRWSSAASDPQWLQVDLGQTYSINKVILNWETAYGKSYQIQTSNDATNWTTIYNTTTGAGGIETLNITGSGRYIRMYGTVRATGYGYSLWEFQVYGTPGTSPTPTPVPPTATPVPPTPTPAPTATPVAGGTNLSQGKTATASSTENGGTLASAAVDGNTGTRWSSAFTDPQWLQVDLGATHTINKVILNWETAYATAYQIQTSNDGTNWTNLYSTTTGAGGVVTLNVSGSGRYVRMYGTARSTGYGYSLWEFQVFGN